VPDDPATKTLFHESSESVFAILQAEVGRTREESIRARHLFWAVSGPGEADNMARIESAARAQVTAVTAYTNAIRECNEFLLNGIIPEEIRKRNKAAH
jgi:hypothetical protein